MAELSIPVRLQLQNMQQLIDTLQKQLSNLKVGSSGFQAIQKIIKQIKDEMDSLQVSTSKPFIDQKQFVQAGHNLDVMEASIDKMSLAMSRLKFTDLKLTPAQETDLANYEAQIKNLKDQLKTLKETSKQVFLNSTEGQDWVKNYDSTAIAQSLSQITNRVRSETSAQEKLFNDAKKALDDYNNAMTAKRNIENFLQTQDPLSRANLGDQLFDKIFDSHNPKKFANGGRSELANYLKQTLSLSDADVAELTKASLGGAEKVVSNLQQNLQNLLQQKVQIIQNNPAAQQQATQEEAKYQSLYAILTALIQQEQARSAAENNLQQDINNTNAAQQQYINNLVNAARNNTAVTDTCNAMRTSVASFRDTLQSTNTQFLAMQRTQQSFNQMKMTITNFMGFTQVLNLTKRAIKDAINHIKELDSVMNKIAIVTDMSTEDLWQQVDQYSKMAQTYGVTIKGAYEVSQIYYQQGLATNDVLTLTNETLKLAKISGLDYAKSTDYMTTAIRGFKMEMSEAATVVDVYSNLAAHTAVTQEELAVAMSKTASSMEGVGATFEESSAMIATMVAVTRESATNIGSAMKSIASRYGELTKDPTKLVDEEGEAMAFNKVDAALQSVGISMRTVDGQFREFTDVIIELGEKWDQLESTQQRYIATQFAGNRQQSRFLALVSNVDLLKSNLDYAENSEDTGTLQALKALDSIESKLNQVQVAYQQFYTTMGLEVAWKAFLDGATNVINTLNRLPKLFGKVPIAAIGAISSTITLIKNLAFKGLSAIAQTIGNSLSQGFMQAMPQAQTSGIAIVDKFITAVRSKLHVAEDTGHQIAQAVATGFSQSSINVAQNTPGVSFLNATQQKEFLANQSIIEDLTKLQTQATQNGTLTSLYTSSIMGTTMEIPALTAAVQQGLLSEQDAVQATIAAWQKKNEALAQTGLTQQQHLQKLGNAWNSFGQALNMAGMLIDSTSQGGKRLSGALMGIGGAVSLASVAFQAFNRTLKTIPWMAIISGIFAVYNGISSILSSFSREARLEELTQKAEELNNKAKELKANYRTLNNSVKKYEELREKRYESAEAAEEYQTAVDELAEKFPALIGGFDSAGNIILDTTNAEEILAKAREESQKATYEAARVEMEKAKLERDIARDDLRRMSIKSLSSAGTSATGAWSYSATQLQQKLGSRSAENAAAMENRDQAFEQLYLTYKSSITEDKNNQYYINDEAKRKKLEQAYGFLENSKTEDKHLSLNLLDQYFQETLKSRTLTSEEREFYNLFFNSQTATEIEAEYNQAAQDLSALLSDMNADPEALTQAYNKLIAITNKAKTSGLFDEDYLKTVTDNLTTLSSLMNTWTTQNNIYKGYEKLVISAWQQSADADQEAWTYLEKSATAAAMVTKQIIAAQENENIEYTEDLGKEFQRTMARFIKSLSPERLELFNKMAEDTEHYSAVDLIKEFGITDTDGENDIFNIIQLYYSDGINAIRTRLVNNLSQQTRQTIKYDDEISQASDAGLVGFYQQYVELINEATTPIQEQYLNIALSQYQALQDADYTQRATQFGDAVVNLFNTIMNETSALVRTNLWNLVKENGLTTLTGLQDTMNAINNNSDISDEEKDQLITYLQSLYENIIPNVSLEIQTATSELLDTWEDTSKELSSALSGGVSLKDAEALIAKAKSFNLDFDLNDFQLVGDKLVLVGTSFDDYYLALTSSMTDRINAWQTKIDDANALLEKAMTSNENLLLEKNRVIFEALGITDLTPYVDENGVLIQLPENIKALNDAINDNQKLLNTYSKATQIAARQILTAHETSQGIYKLIINGVETNLSEDLEALKAVAQGEVIAGANRLDTQAMKESVNSAYNTFISDVLSKGFNKIHLEDYEGLVNKDQIDLSNFKNNYQAFVTEYVDLAGLSIEEANALIAQAVEKDRKTQSADVLKDIEFKTPNLFKTSLQGLQDLANTFEVSLNDLLARAEEDGDNYLLTLDKLTDLKINLSDVTNYSEQVADSVNSFFDSIISYIKNGLSGSLSFVDRTELIKWADSVGIKDLDFTETAEGLKLAQTSAIELYDALKKTYDLKSKLLFDELNKSLEESNEHYKTISSIQEHIIDLTAKLNDIDKQADPTRAQQYEQELTLAKEILAVRSTEENSGFSFMSRKIPGAQNNPLNYYRDWIKGWNELNDAFKSANQGTYTRDGQTIQSGFIDYESWSALVYEMNNIAKLGGQFEVAGVTLDGSLERAAELIDKGAQSIVSTDSGEIKVALNGMALDFTNGTADFKDGVTKGIQELANSQVKMLDGIIKFLETVVQMEKLGEIAGDDGVIDLSDIIHFNEETKTTEYTQDYVNFLDELSTADQAVQERFKSILINDTNLWDILHQDADKFTKEQAAAINAVYQAYKSGEYDLESLVASIRDILNGTSDEYNVTLTDEGILQVERKVQVKEETTYTTEDGTETTNPLQAVQNFWQTVGDGIKGLFKPVIDSAKEHYTMTEQVDVTAKKVNLTLADNVDVVTTNMILPNISYDKVLTCLINLLKLKKDSTGKFKQNPGDVIPEDLTDEETSAIISTLKLVKGAAKEGLWQQQGDVQPEALEEEDIDAFITTLILKKAKTNGEWQEQGNVLPENLQNQLVTALITALQLKWAENVDTSPNYEALGLKEEYTAPDATVTQNVKVEWSFVGEGKQLNAQATAIRETLNASGLPSYFGGGNTFLYQLDNSAVSEQIQQLIADYVKQGGTRYTVENGWVYELVADVNNESLEDSEQTINESLVENIDDLAISPNLTNVVKAVNAYKPPRKTMTIDAEINEPDIPRKTSGTGAKNTEAAPIQMAKAKGTLMGELGPELVVSNGHYFVAGQNGPEMVNLADDAIVFNHLQTRSLLEKGTAKGRGKAITNERNAVAYAHGNMQGGPAKASASEALNALIQLRDQWKTLAALTVEDLTKKAGGGGGGGGDATFIKDLERWYNWLQEIAKLEEKINYEEAKRSKMESDFQRNGKDYYQSQIDSLKLLEREVQIQQDLVDEQTKYFNARREALNTQSAFSSLYTFDTEGQIKYASGQFARLSEMFGSDATTGVPNHSVKEQYDWLISQGYGYAMQYNESGEEIKATDEEGMKSAIEAFWAKIEADKTEMQELHDSVEEHKNAVLEKQQAQNEILKAIEDNQISVESKVLGAIEDFRQRTIDEMQKERDAIEKSNSALIKGLQDSLSKERQMYEHSTADKELTMLQRQLAILKRSGGSATEIASLEEQLADKQQDAYFTAQEEQINALQEASDKQLERLDKQIELEEEALEYEKLHGMLWEQVYDVMARSPEDIAAFIKENNSEYWGKSPAELAQNMRDDLFEAEQWKAYAENGVSINDLVGRIADVIAGERKSEEATNTNTTETSNASASATSVANSKATKSSENRWTVRYDKASKQWIAPQDPNGEYTSYAEAKRVKERMNSGGSSNPQAAPRMLTLDNGGIIDKDQVAFVHAKEGVFTSEQLSVLRNDILGSSKNSLLNLLQDFRTAYTGLGASVYNNSAAVTIEHAAVHMHVDKLADKYDAADAADDVMQELLTIARKSYASNRIGGKA